MTYVLKDHFFVVWMQEWTQGDHGDHPEWSIPKEFLTLPDGIYHTLVIISIIALMDFQICLPELDCKTLLILFISLVSRIVCILQLLIKYLLSE